MPRQTPLTEAHRKQGAKLVQDHPKRFGLFAAMPMPDVDATLAEIAHAYDALKVDGANVICGGVQTANATVYLVDSVLMPK